MAQARFNGAGTLNDGTRGINGHTEDPLKVHEVPSERDLPQSYFPCLDSRPRASQAWQGTEVPFKDFDLLRAWCQHQNIDPFLVFQAAWILVLNCYLSDPHISFAIDRSQQGESRSRSGSPNTIISWGEVHLEQCATSLDLVKQVRTRRAWLPIHSAKDGANHHDLQSRKYKSPANTCLLYRISHHEISPGLDLTRLQQHADDGYHFKVVPYIQLGQRDIFVSLYYLDSVLSVVSAANVAAVYSHAIEQLLIYNERSLDEIDLFSQRDLIQIRKWNQRMPEKVNSCVHDIILSHAERRPQSFAIDSWDGRLTYAELDALSFKLAIYFVQAGIQPESLVPVCFTKSVHAVVAMLAVHRAGGAFIPLDVSHPQERLKTIIRKARAKIVIAGEDTAHRFVGASLSVITVSAEMLQKLQPDTATQLPKVEPYNAAFVLFTSGSTGEPKGIVQEHSSVCTSAVRHGRAMDMNSESRVFQYAAFAFDVSMMDNFSTMICGGCVCIPSEKDRLGDFTPVMNKLKANWVLFTPSVASLIKPDDVPLLKTLVFGGEAVKKENITRWSGKVKLLNCYGPAESCACSIGRFEEERQRPSNIGRQFDGGLNWVVDPQNHHRLKPIGSVGELVVEGPTLARGYIDDLVRTKASFIKNPTWPIEMNGIRRVYKTGDLVRQNSDGTFDFVGRKDHQLKIRGQRVELGEIEYHLAKYPGIALSTVLHPLGGAYAQYLSAVIQLQQKHEIIQNHVSSLEHLSPEDLSALDFDAEAINNSLKSVLPPYMVPQRFIVVRHIPLSPSGKIDRRAVEAWLQGMTRLVQVETKTFHHERNGILPNVKSDPIAMDIGNEVSAMIDTSDMELHELLRQPDLPLNTLALNSIQTIALTMFIRKKFGVAIDLHDIVSPGSTISSIAEVVRTLQCNNSTQSSTLSLDATKFFGKHRTQALKNFAKEKECRRNVFLTGGTGFLGARIVFRLCEDETVSKVIVLARHQNSEQDSGQPLNRVIRSMQDRGWWRNAYLEKLEAWAGNLAKPKLGLSTGQWYRLCGHGSVDEQITTIIHNGAIVNWNSTFDSLKATNVDSTIELLRAAAESSALEHFVFVSGGQQLRLGADDERVISEEVMASTGYAQSKFLSELLVKDYANKVASSKQDVSVIKPGYIIGALEDGVAPAGDYIWRLAATCAFNRAYSSADTGAWLFVSDVDRIATAIVDACSSQAINQVHNRDAKIVKILDGLPVEEFWRIVEDELGCRIQALPSEAWADRIYCDIEKRREKHPLWPLLYTLEKSNGLIGAAIELDNKIAYDKARVVAALRKNIDYLQKTGQLQKPDIDSCIQQKTSRGLKVQLKAEIAV